jgi:hypothetical protein
MGIVQKRQRETTESSTEEAEGQEGHGEMQGIFKDKP